MNLHLEKVYVIFLLVLFISLNGNGVSIFEEVCRKLKSDQISKKIRVIFTYINEFKFNLYIFMIMN